MQSIAHIGTSGLDGRSLDVMSEIGFIIGLVAFITADCTFMFGISRFITGRRDNGFLHGMRYLGYPVFKAFAAV